MGLGLGQAGISGDSVTSGKDTFGSTKEGGRCRSDSVRLREIDARGPAMQHEFAEVDNSQPPGRSCAVGENLDGEL